MLDAWLIAHLPFLFSKESNVIRRLLAVTSVAALTIVSPVLAQTTIERIAPENSVFVIGVKNAQESMQRVQRTGLWSFWQSNEMKALRADLVKELSEGLDKAFRELGVEEGSLVPPTGALGLAVFPVMNQETGMPQAALLIMADYGENAEKTNELILAALDYGEKEGNLEYEEEDIAGRTLYVIDLASMNDDADEDMDDFGGMGGMMPMGDPSDMFEGIEKLYYVRDAGVLMFGTDLASLTEALEAVDGRGRAGVGERAEFRGVMDQIGENDIYAVLLTRDIMDLLAASDPMGMMMMMRPTLRALVGEVQGYGMGARFDTPAAMVEQSLGIYMPRGKRGLTALMDRPAPRAMLPAFISSDTISYSSFTFNFSGLMGVIRDVINSNFMLQAQAGEWLDQIEPVVNQVTATLGTQIHSASTLTKPITAGSNQMLTAIECTNPTEFENLFASVAAQAGMEPRDFLGQRIYTLDGAMLGMMMGGMPGAEVPSISLGIGGGFVMIGTTPAVEQGLRATGERGAAGLTDNARFRRAMAALSNEPVVAWGYSELVDTIESAILQQLMQQEQFIEELRQWGDDEFADEVQADIDEQRAVIQKINFDQMRQYFGPSSWEVRSVADGFIARSYLLAPAN